jgi:CheY-like chemotaxis protein
MGHPMTASAQPLAGLRVLYVDDNPDALALTALLLNESGATMVAVTSAEEAIVAFDREQPDVLVSDTQMPGRDGWWLIEQIRTRSDALGGKTPVLALSAAVSDAEVARSIRSGFTAFLAKPVEIEELTRTIARLAGRGDTSSGAGV